LRGTYFKIGRSSNNVCWRSSFNFRYYTIWDIICLNWFCIIHFRLTFFWTPYWDGFTLRGFHGSSSLKVGQRSINAEAANQKPTTVRRWLLIAADSTAENRISHRERITSVAALQLNTEQQSDNT
jgi:hypothetical protein